MGCRHSVNEQDAETSICFVSSAQKRRLEACHERLFESSSGAVFRVLRVDFVAVDASYVGTGAVNAPRKLHKSFRSWAPFRFPQINIGGLGKSFTPFDRSGAGEKRNAARLTFKEGSRHCTNMEHGGAGILGEFMLIAILELNLF